MSKKKFYITTTIPLSLYFFKGQPRLWNTKFDVCVLSADIDELERFAQEEGVRYKCIPMHREISLLSDFLCLVRFIWVFLKDRPYIVHGNTPKASLLSMVAAWLTRRPVRVYMCHGLRYQGSKGFLRKLLIGMEKISCACATCVLCVSRGVANLIVADGLCKKEKVRVVGFGSAGGVDTQIFNPDIVDSSIRKDLGIPKEDLVYSFVGRVVKDKGINELVSAFDKLSTEYNDVHLLVVGPIEDIQNPIDYSTREAITINPRIHYVGMQKDVRPYLKISDVFVLPSYREGFGMVLIEAGAMGLPCITTNITGCNEIIEHGENGLIINAKDEDALFYEMELLHDNPAIIQHMAKNARRMVIERYECHDVWDRYFDFYQEL